MLPIVRATAHRPNGTELKDAAETITAFGFCAGCLAYALGAIYAFVLRIEVDLTKLAVQAGFVVGFGGIVFFGLLWTGLAD